MSLKSFLEENEIDERFKKEFKWPNLIENRKLLVPALSKRTELINSALNYLLLFKLKKINSNFLNSPCIAKMSLEIARVNSSKVFHEKARKIIEKSEKNLSGYYDNKNNCINNSILESAFYLAQLEEYVLNGNEIVIRPHPQDLKELKCLMELFDSSNFKSKKICLWNPSFEGSRLVGGAKIDLVVDDIIIKIDNSENLKGSCENFNQLIGQYMLYCLGGIGGMDKSNKIRKIGIYFSRFAFLYVLDLESIINEEKFSEFLHWFEEKAVEKYS